MNAPSPYAILVIRALLTKPMRIPELVSATKLDERTIKAQISALFEAKAIYVKDRVQVRWGGRWAVYAPVIHVPL
jgi:DNA-binding HxlR family transcriptional regulator